MSAGEVLRLDVPASSEQLRLVRLIVASVATSHGADMDDLEDLRIATGEVCAALVEGADGSSRLRVEVEVVPEGLHSTVRLCATLDRSERPVELDELSAMVLDTTADGFGVGTAPWSDTSAPAAVWMQRSIRAPLPSATADDA